MPGFVLICPATRGLALALTRHYLRTTALPVVATYRPHPPSSSSSSAARAPDAVRAAILRPFASPGASTVDPSRLHLLPLDLLSDPSIAAAAALLAAAIHAPSFLSSSAHAAPFIHTAFFAGGVLHPERSPAALSHTAMLETFQTNVIAHLLLLKHFARFLPPPPPSRSSRSFPLPALPGEVGARLRARRLHRRQPHRGLVLVPRVVRTFDLHLQAARVPALAVGVHPGTVKTDLSRAFWNGVPAERLFSPEYAAERLAGVVGGLREEQRGRVWDWSGEEVPP